MAITTLFLSAPNWVPLTESMSSEEESDCEMYEDVTTVRCQLGRTDAIAAIQSAIDANKAQIDALITASKKARADAEMLKVDTMRRTDELIDLLVKSRKEQAHWVGVEDPVPKKRRTE